METKSCCSPADNGIPSQPAVTDAGPAENSSLEIHICAIPGGEGHIGTDNPFLPQDAEAPFRSKRIKPFIMMQTTVTNKMFANFTEDTGFVTEAERYGWSYVFAHNVSAAVQETQAVKGVEWWRRVEGAHWRLVNGPESEADYNPDHPVVHVSWNDAKAFAKWAGGRLPTEAEWEHAARGGLGDVPFPWGTAEPDDTGFFPCNIWQGQFPHTNTIQDGYAATAPAKSFTPNGFNLYNMCGNVWEWTAEPLKLRTLSKKKLAQSHFPKGSKLLKGGSFLCHRSYCYRYRIPARSGTTADTTTAHQGFRLVFDQP